MNSSPPSSSPAKRRKKQPKSCCLVRLPASVLGLIFGDLSEFSLDHVTLCRALHPVLIERLYALVELDTERKVASFASAIIRHPERARLVSTLLVRQDAFKPGKNAVIDLEDGEKGAGQLDELATAPSPTNLTVGIGLLKDIVFRLSSVDMLMIWGGQLARHLFSPDVVAHPLYPRLRSVYIILASEPQHSFSAGALWSYLGALPRLDMLAVHNFDSLAAGSVLSVDPQTCAPPRSLHVEFLSIIKVKVFTFQFRHVLQSLAHGVKSVELEGWVAYSSLLDDLVLLPPTVKYLEITLGPPTCASAALTANWIYRSCMAVIDRARREAPDAMPSPLTTSLASLPNLVAISLQGDIVSSKTFEYLGALEHLTTFRLGTHTRFETSDVVGFVRAAAALETLWIEVCCCVPLVAAAASAPPRPARPAARAPSCSSTAPSPATKPAWRPGFDLNDARTLVDECRLCGVAVGGTIACASGRFGPDEHLCEGWCAML